MYSYIGMFGMNHMITSTTAQRRPTATSLYMGAELRDRSRDLALPVTITVRVVCSFDLHVTILGPSCRQHTNIVENATQNVATIVIGVLHCSSGQKILKGH